jgi:hypothetical protein
MNDQIWSEVDRYICDRLLPADPVLEAALAAGLPEISVTANQGKLNVIRRGATFSRSR